MLHKGILTTITICLLSWFGIAFAGNIQHCAGGFAGGEFCQDLPENEGGVSGLIGGFVGENIDSGIGDLITEYGDLAYGLAEDFSLGNLLQAGCTATTSAVDNNEENEENNNESSEENSEEGGGINISTEDAQSALCFANDGYKVIDDFNSQMPLLLEKWGTNLFSDGLQYDLGLGEYLTGDEIDEFSQEVAWVVTGKNENGEDLSLEERIVQLSQGDASRKITEATWRKMQAQRNRLKVSPDGTVEGNWENAILANPNLAVIAEQGTLQELKSIEKSAQSLENSLLSGEIATLGGQKTEVIQEMGESLNQYEDVKTKQIDTAPSSRAALGHNGKTLVDAITLNNTTQQQISAQMGLSLRNDAIMTSQVGILAEAESQKITRDLNSSKGILENAVNKHMDTYESISQGMTGVGSSISRLSSVKDEQGQRTIGGGDGIVGNGLF